MSKIDELMALADAYADHCRGWQPIDHVHREALRTAIEAALKPGEPVAYAVYDIKYGGSASLHWAGHQHSDDGDAEHYKGVPLYAAPPAPVQGEPVAWMYEDQGSKVLTWCQPRGECVPLYTVPPAQTPPPRLTDDTITIAYQMGRGHADGLRAIESAVRKQFLGERDE